MNFSLEQLNIIKVEKISEEEILKYLEENSSSLENQVLKIMLSEKYNFFKKFYLYKFIMKELLNAILLQ